MSDQPSGHLPTDKFSQRMRELTDNPGAIRAESTVHVRDHYGNTESWIIETFRVNGHEEMFVQRNSAADPFRLVFPPEVTAVIASQRERLIDRSRRRAARRAIETRRERGDTLGNPAALQLARAARKRGAKRKRGATKAR